MLKQKKAFFFTLTILFLIALLLLISFSYRKEYTKESIKTRILAGNSLIEGIEKDAERAIYISGSRTVLALIDYIETTNKYINESAANFSSIFEEAFINGTLERTLNYKEAEKLLENTTLEDWKNEIILKVNTSRFTLTFFQASGPLVTINQSTPWAIDMSVALNYTLEDKQLGAIWHRDIKVPGKIFLANLEDPSYVLEFSRSVANILHKTPYTTFVDDSCNVINLTAHLEGPQTSNQTGSYYTNNSKAPNFLNRLKGNFSAKDATGIESIIHRQKMENKGIGIQNSTSLVDHSYFRGVGTNLTGVVNMPDWFLITCAEANEVYKISASCTTSVEC